MNTAQPIRDVNDLKTLKNYYALVDPNPRNYLLIILGLNTALRISDLLTLKWADVYDFRKKGSRQHIELTEQKTGKYSCIYLNSSIQGALANYWNYYGEKKGQPITASDFLFSGRGTQGNPISRVQAFRIIRKAANSCNLNGCISCHSLRKTFGYYAWQQGTSPALLMSIYNHSSFRVTQRYLGIEQDDRDQVFQNIEL